MSRSRRTPSHGWALAADAVCVLVFVLVGRSAHDESDALTGVLRTLGPFAVGLAVAWGLLVLTAQDPMRLRTGPLVGVVTALVGLGVRAAVGQGVAVSFAIVAVVVLSVFATAWRAALWAASRGGSGRARRGADGADPHLH